jgi:hypothetical protein
VSGVYAYCVVSGRRPPAGLSGLHDRPVTGREVDGLVVWVTEAEEPPTLDLDAVARHHAVVSAALGAPMLPLRFGAWQPELECLANLVRGSSSELTETMRRVAGRVELGIRLARRGAEEDPRELAEPAEAASGRAYLRELSRRRSIRIERRQEQNELARRLKAHMEEMATEQRVQYLSPPALISVAHLVDPRDERSYRERAASFARAEGELVVHVTGPWPPYSFAS